MVSNRRAAEVVRLALERGGRITPTDLGQSGVSPRQLRELARSGVLLRLRRGFYVLPGFGADRGAYLGHVARFLGGVVSHSSAAELYGLDLGGDGSELGHVTIAADRSVTIPPGIVVHRSRHLRPEDLKQRGETSLTAPARTLVDLAAMRPVVSDSRLVWCFDQFVGLHLLTVGGLEGYLGEVPKLRGVARVRRLAVEMGDKQVESIAERRFLRLMTDAGLPEPRSQVSLYDDDGHFLGRVDFAWPRDRVVVEVDGYRCHPGTRAFRVDRERTARIQAEGWAVYRTTPAEIGEGAPAIVTALRKALGGTGPVTSS